MGGKNASPKKKKGKKEKGALAGNLMRLHPRKLLSVCPKRPRKSKGEKRSN